MDVMTNPIGSIQPATYLDFTEVWQYLQFPAAPTSREQNLLQRYIDSACTFAQGAEGANRPIVPTEYTERHDGWSGEYILLNHSPIVELILCREWMSTGGFVTLPESTPESPTEGIQVDYGTGRIMRTFSGYSWPRPFFPGSRNIEVTYAAGFNPLPADIWEATAELVGWKWRNSQQASRSSAPVPAGAGFESPATNQYAPGCPPDIQAVFQSYCCPTFG